MYALSDLVDFPERLSMMMNICKSNDTAQKIFDTTYKEDLDQWINYKDKNDDISMK